MIGNVNRTNSVKRKKLSIQALKAYSFSKCQKDCKLPDVQMQATIDHSKEIYREIELLSESKIMKARGFNRMYEMGVRIQRTIEKMSKYSTKKL